VIDVLVDDEAQAVAAAASTWASSRAAPRHVEAPDRALRDVVPENRLRVYDTRAVHRHGLVDAGSCWNCARLWHRHPHRAGAHRRPPRGLMANNPHTWAARSTPTPPTRPRASCSCATRTACRW
jgi:acetyl-CoA carboxylase carboxyltransferase component